MRIGVDAGSFANARGYGRFLRELLPHLLAAGMEDEFLLFIERQNAASVQGLAPNARVLAVDLDKAPTEAARADGSRSPGDMLRMTRAVKAERPDVFFFPTVYTYFPMPRGQKTLVTIHDAIAERFPALTLPSLKARLFWNAKVWLARRQASLILTVSDFSARELAEVFGLGPARVRVSGEAPGAAFSPSEPGAIRTTAAKYGVPDKARWLIYCGGFNPHKHVEAVVEAHAMVLETTAAPLYLLLVGTKDKDVFHGAQASIHAAIREAKSESRVLWTGFVPDEDLRHLYAGAVALLLPSALEGFGLPAVEAAACGTPVIATKRSPLPELLSGGGNWVDPGDSVAMATTLECWLADEEIRSATGRNALARARTMTWRGAAERTLAALREAAS